MVEFHTPYIPQNLRLLEKKNRGAQLPTPSFPPPKINSLTHTLTSLTIAMEASKARQKARLMAQSEKMFLTPAGGPKSCVNNLRFPPARRQTSSNPPTIPHWEEEEVDSLANWFWLGKSKLLSVKHESGENTQFSIKKLLPNSFFIKCLESEKHSIFQ